MRVYYQTRLSSALLLPAYRGLQQLDSIATTETGHLHTLSSPHLTMAGLDHATALLMLLSALAWTVRKHTTCLQALLRYVACFGRREQTVCM